MSATSLIHEHLDIPYLPNPDGKFHAFDLYVPQSTLSKDSLPPLLVFVHGGAWRSEDKADYKGLAQRLAELTSFPVALPNYRLTAGATPDLRHPAHAEDLLAFLTFLLDWPGPDSSPARRPYNPSKLYVLGHSCAPHMLTSIFLSSPSYPTLVPSPRLVSSLRALVLSSGLFDLDLLLRSFPRYASWFVEPTFGAHDSYAAVSPVSMALPEAIKRVKWLIVHSRGDTWVDVVQSQGMVRQLESQGAEWVVLDEGLDEEHDVVMKQEAFPKLVSRYILEWEKE